MIFKAYITELNYDGTPFYIYTQQFKSADDAYKWLMSMEECLVYFESSFITAEEINE